MTVQRISAITLRVSDMARAVGFYSDVLGLEVRYGGPNSFFSSLRTAGARDLILNLGGGRVQELRTSNFPRFGCGRILALPEVQGLQPAEPERCRLGRTVLLPPVRQLSPNDDSREVVNSSASEEDDRARVLSDWEGEGGRFGRGKRSLIRVTDPCFRLGLTYKMGVAGLGSRWEASRS